MPNKDYINGRGAEHRAKARLEEQGFTVFRTAGSKSLCDLIAFGELCCLCEDHHAPDHHQTVFVQVKNGLRPMSRADKARFKEFALQHGARPLLISRGNVWSWLDEDEEKAA